ncbi:MAG: hypothetical protein AB6733_00085 [Clostridiaceae bacterium]
MAKYRQIHTSFWQDGFVLDLTPEEKYFYIYLLTNSKTTQCGIYELPKKVIEIETGYNIETVTKLLQRFIDYGKIEYDDKTKELMVKNWIRYNPITNVNMLKCIVKEIESIKHEIFAKVYISTLNSDLEIDKEGLIRGLQGAYKELPSNKVISNKEEVINKKKEVRSKNIPDKINFAEFVSMTSDEYQKLIDQYGEAFIKEKIIDLNLWKGSKGKKTKSDYMTLLSWIRRDAKGAANGSAKSNTKPNSGNDYDFSKYTG